jgi:hypothetical protein
MTERVKQMARHSNSTKEPNICVHPPPPTHTHTFFGSLMYFMTLKLKLTRGDHFSSINKSVSNSMKAEPFLIS